MSISSFAPAVQVQSTTVNAVANVLGSASPVGGIVGLAAQALQAIGISIKGSTQHLSYAQCMQKAPDFSNQMHAIFAAAYSADEIMAIQQKVPARFEAAMQSYWGLTISLNQQILVDIKLNVNVKDELFREMGLFYLWVGTNIDAESADEFSTTFPSLFTDIFLAAISDAGLSADKLKSTTAVTPPASGMNPIVQGNTVNPGTTTAVSQAGFGGLGMLLLLGAGVALAMKGGKL